MISLAMEMLYWQQLNLPSDDRGYEPKNSSMKTKQCEAEMNHNEREEEILHSVIIAAPIFINTQVS